MNVEFAAEEYAEVAGSTRDSGRFQELYVVHQLLPFPSVDKVRLPAPSYPNDVVICEVADTGCVCEVSSPVAS